MLDEVKIALDLSDDLYDTELAGFIESAKRDLSFGNVDTVSTTDLLTKTAIITYCSYMFQLMHGDIERANALKLSYDSLKTQMGINSNYRDWGELDG